MKQIILHQVNCQGVMGAGFALYIKKTYPLCFIKYKEICDSNTTKSNLLGTFQVFEGDLDIILNMFSQDRYGRGKCQTNYQAMEKALNSIRLTFPTETITAPDKIGCGLAGGDWRIVSKLLKKYDIQVSNNIVLKEEKGS